MKPRKDLLICIAMLGIISLTVLGYKTRTPPKGRATKIHGANNLATPYPARQVTFSIPAALTGTNVDPYPMR